MRLPCVPDSCDARDTVAARVAGLHLQAVLLMGK